MKITELRRNPELNPKQNSLEYAVEYLKSIGDLSRVGVSMTRLPKLGINPTSNFESPVGIYFYPAVEFIELMNRAYGVPYGNFNNYIQIFKYTGNVLEVDRMDDSATNSYIEVWVDNSDKIAKVLGVKAEDVIDKIRSSKYYAQRSSGLNFWFILYEISNLFSKENKGRIAKRNAVVRNYLLRMLGVDVVIDNGKGIIHPNEPCQGIVLSPNIITHIKTIDNKFIDRGDKWQQLTVVKNWLYKRESIIGAGNECVKDKLEFHPMYTDICADIINKLVELSDTEKFYHVDYKYIDALLKLSKDKNLANTIALKYFSKTVDELVEELIEFKSKKNKMFDYVMRQCKESFDWLSNIKGGETLSNKLSKAIQSIGIK